MTIPVDVVIAQGWKPGQAFRVEMRGHDLVLVPEQDILERRKRVLAETRGQFAGMYEPGYLEKLRDEWG